MKRFSKNHMTNLERGLALYAFRHGMPVYKIAEALHRCPKTIRRVTKERLIRKSKE